MLRVVLPMTQRVWCDIQKTKTQETRKKTVIGTRRTRRTRFTLCEQIQAQQAGSGPHASKTRILDFVAASRASPPPPSCPCLTPYRPLYSQFGFSQDILETRHELLACKRPMIGRGAGSTRRTFLWVALLVVAGARLHIGRGRKLGLALTGVANLETHAALATCLQSTRPSLGGGESLGCGGRVLGVVWVLPLPPPALAFTLPALCKKARPA